MSLVALGVLAVVALAALAAPVILPYDPDAPDAERTLEAPSRRHWLGTDLYGRDQLTRIVYAGRVDLLVAVEATAIALSLGAVLGAVSGYRGGWIDQILMRMIDTIQAFPVVHPRDGDRGGPRQQRHQHRDRDRDHPRAHLRPPHPRGDAARS